jgi:hypothetical protein
MASSDAAGDAVGGGSSLASVRPMLWANETFSAGFEAMPQNSHKVIDVLKREVLTTPDVRFVLHLQQSGDACKKSSRKV